MSFVAKFSEQDNAFVARFGEVNNVSDGGYERGYEAGYEKGNTEGYNKGHAEGVEQGYADGSSESLDALVNNTLKSYINKTSTTIKGHTFRYSTELEYVDFHALTRVPTYTFAQCTGLKAFVIRTNRVCTLDNINAFDGSGLDNKTCFLYVPDNLVESYKAASKWSTYASQIKPLSELGE